MQLELTFQIMSVNATHGWPLTSYTITMRFYCRHNPHPPPISARVRHSNDKCEITVRAGVCRTRNRKSPVNGINGVRNKLQCNE